MSGGALSRTNSNSPPCALEPLGLESMKAFVMIRIEIFEVKSPLVLKYVMFSVRNDNSPFSTSHVLASDHSQEVPFISPVPSAGRTGTLILL